MPTPEQPLYQIHIGREPQKILKRCPADLLRRLMAAIKKLATEPRPSGCKKLVGKYDHWRIRVGDWRITYTIQDDELIIVIVEVSPRGGAYRSL